MFRMPDGWSVKELTMPECYEYAASLLTSTKGVSFKLCAS